MYAYIPTYEEYCQRMEAIKNRYAGTRFPTQQQHEEQRKRRYNAYEWLEALRNRYPDLCSLYSERYGNPNQPEE